MFRLTLIPFVVTVFAPCVRGAELQLLHIEASEIQDGYADEPAIIADVDRKPRLVWKRDNVKDNDGFNLDHLDPIRFDDVIEIEVWERDNPPIDDHELLGRIRIKANRLGKRKQKVTLTNGDRDYIYVVQFTVKP